MIRGDVAVAGMRNPHPAGVSRGRRRQPPLRRVSDPLHAPRGVIYGLAVGAMLWIVILWSIVHIARML